MATWNELFLDQRFIEFLPQPEVYKFIRKLEGIFPERPLNLWDLCCGAGRHTVLLSQMNHLIYGSDIAVNGISHAQKWLKDNGLTAELKVADMTVYPFEGVVFHGVICWDALHHNTRENISKSVALVYDNLAVGGMFMVTLLSPKAGAYCQGCEIEKNTFVKNDGAEAGVPHHYFDEIDLRDLFNAWKIVILAEQVYTYLETEPDFYITNPFPYTKWNVIVQK
jgi:ubiquinone/menaquinone biosynthesis C-methylase UbiE